MNKCYLLCVTFTRVLPGGTREILTANELIDYSPLEYFVRYCRWTEEGDYTSTGVINFAMEINRDDYDKFIDDFS